MSMSKEGEEGEGRREYEGGGRAGRIGNMSEEEEKNK